MKRAILLFALFAILLSGCLSASQPAVGFYQRADGDISFQRTTYLPLLTNAHSIELGTAVSNLYIGDTRYNQILAANFERITPEIEGGYWWIYGRGNGWGWMDNIVEIAEANDQEILYHNLRWWWEAQPPDIRVWITEAMTRYPMITDWVVVNEGWGYCNQTIPLIDESFVIAREVRPDCSLVVQRPAHRHLRARASHSTSTARVCRCNRDTDAPQPGCRSRCSSVLCWTGCKRTT